MEHVNAPYVRAASAGDEGVVAITA
jgi:hypothetical protein